MLHVKQLVTRLMNQRPEEQVQHQVKQVKQVVRKRRKEKVKQETRSRIQVNYWLLLLIVQRHQNLSHRSLLMIT